jgi:hypothetical protein
LKIGSFITLGFQGGNVQARIRRCGKGFRRKHATPILEKHREQTCAIKASLVLDATGQHPLTFSSMAQASAWIRIMKARKGPEGMTYSPVKAGGDVFSAAHENTF